MNVGTTASKDHVELVFLPTLLARIGAAAANVSVWAHTFRDYGDEALANGALDLVAVPPRVEIAPFQLVAAWHERDARDAPQRCFASSSSPSPPSRSARASPRARALRGSFDKTPSRVA